MKVFVILLVLIGFVLISTITIDAHSQNQDMGFFYLPLTTQSKNYSILAQSASVNFVNVFYDESLNSLLFSISSSNEFEDTISITMTYQTYWDLFTESGEEYVGGIQVLINGDVIPYKKIQDDNLVTYLFKTHYNPAQIEIRPSQLRMGVDKVPDLEKLLDTLPLTHPPLKQSHLGIASNEIQCKENLVLLQKYDGTSACVTESTKQKLIERGWTGNITQNINQEFFSKYGIDYDGLVVRDAHAAVYKTVQNNVDQRCFTLTSDMLDGFADDFLQDLESAAEEEFHYDPQIYPPGVYSGYGMQIDKDYALDFVKKYNFNATTQVFSDNIASIPDKQYRFDCFFDYFDKQYMLRLEFEQQIHDGSFVNVNVTRNDQGIPTIINDNITVYSGGFNSTILFHNKLDSDIVLSSDESIVYNIDEDGDINENTFAKTLSEFDQVIPPEKFFSYYFAAHREKINQPITYVIEPYGLNGSIILKQYPHCMTESQVVSLYNEVKVYPKFPSYLPDGYSFECGIHNTNAFVHLVYTGMTDSDQYESIYDRKFLADGGLVIDYYDEAWNGWNEDPRYDKHENANETAAHPWAETFTISDNPAVMIEEHFWQSGEQRSFNRLEVFFDEDKVRISSSLPKTELIKIAESLQVRK